MRFGKDEDAGWGSELRLRKGFGTGPDQGVGVKWNSDIRRERAGPYLLNRLAVGVTWRWALGGIVGFGADG